MKIAGCIVGSQAWKEKIMQNMQNRSDFGTRFSIVEKMPVVSVMKCHTLGAQGRPLTNILNHSVSNNIKAQLHATVSFVASGQRILSPSSWGPPGVTKVCLYLFRSVLCTATKSVVGLKIHKA